VLEALMAAGRERGYREVLLHAQLSAAGFYTRAGFVQRGPVFEEAGIGHVEMVRAL
jgi:predicted GNAT family N-acyltransferase